MVEEKRLDMLFYELASEVEVDQWYLISGIVVDNTLQLIVDGVKVLEVQDYSLAKGAIGFITYGGTMQAKQVSVQSSALDPNSWPMWRNDPSHSGYTTSTGLTTNQTLWTFTTNASISDAVVANDIVYFSGGDGYFYALNASTGKQIWNKLGSTGVPAVSNGIVYVTGEFAEISAYNGLFALNASTGERIWNVTNNFGPSGTPTVVDGRVYVGYGAFDAYTGNLIWTCLGQPLNISYNERVLLNNPPVANGIVYGRIHSPSFIYALNSSTGKEIWHQQTGSGVYSASAFTVVNCVVYLGDDVAGLYALNASTGEKIWRISVQSTPWTGPYSFVMSTPAVVNGIAYIGAYGQMLALNASTGIKIWNYTTGVSMWSSPAVAGDVVYIGSGESHPLDDIYHARQPGSFNVFKDDKVYAFNATTGKIIWSYQTDDSVDSAPAIASGIVYVSSGGKLYAFGQIPTPTPTPSPTLTPSPTVTSTPSPSPTPTSPPTPTPTITPSSTPSPSPSPNPSPSPSPTTTPTVSPTPSPTPSPSPSPNSTATPTPTPTSTIIPTPTASSTPSPSPSPTATPSPTPTTAPTSTSTTTVSPTPISTPNPGPTETPITASPSPTLSQSLPSPTSQPQSTATPLYVYAAVVLAIFAIGISAFALTTKRRR